jgi:ribonuclease R
VDAAQPTIALEAQTGELEPQTDTPEQRVLEENASEQPAAPAPRPRGRPRKTVTVAPAEESAAPVKRPARARKAPVVVTPVEEVLPAALEVTSEPSLEPSDPSSLEPEPISAEPAPSAEAAPPARARRRKLPVADAAPEPAQSPVRARARGRRAAAAESEPQTALFEPASEDATELEVPAPQPSSDESLKDSADVAPKRLVRVRKAARENVFESQARTLNPLEALLEHLRVNPGGQALRDLERDLDDALLARLGGRKGLEESLSELEALGAVAQLKRHTYSAAREAAAVVGRLSVRPDGWGVVTPDTPGLREMLVPPGALFCAWHGDRVVARETKKNGELFGAIIRVLERARTRIVGSLEYSRGALVLRPDEERLPCVPLVSDVALPSGARVVAFARYPETSGEDDAYAHLERVLGEHDSLEVERQAVRVRYGLEDGFSNDALKEAQKEAGIATKDLQGRVDLRAKRVTAARVQDSAPLEVGVQAEPLGNGNVLIGVHVADAAYFVTEGKALDAAAASRGVRVDLAGEVVPMLPEALERVAAFKVGADRLALSVLLEATPDGNVVNYIVRQSVINAKATLEDGLQAPERELIERLANGLRAARGLTSGAETEAQMLEELLLLAGRLAAATLASLDAPALYRRAPRRGAELDAALERAQGASPAMLEALERAHTRPGAFVMALAPDPETTLEFARGLSSYADLVNARIIGYALTKLSARRREGLLETLPALAEHLNATERRTQAATRAVEQYRARAALTPGSTVRGIVLDLDPWGLEFALENGACARLSVHDMDDEYAYSDAPKMFKARSGRVFRTGSIARVNLLELRRPSRLGLKAPGATAPRAHANGLKENTMSKKKRPQTGRDESPRRQVVVLHAKPRGEHQRGVRVTARKLYFGEWSRAAFVASDEFGGEIAVERPQPSSQRPQNGVGSRPNNAPRSNQQPSRPQNPNAPRAGQSPNRDQNRASKIAEIKRRSEQTLERNAERAVRGPLEGTNAPKMSAKPAQSPAAQNAAPQNAAPRAEGAPHRRRRRGRGGNKPAAS